MVTLPTQASAAARMLDRFHARLGEHQANYMARTGKYWQGSGLDLRPFAADLGIRPTDQPDDWRWSEGFGFPRLPGFVRVDVYEGPQGWGYVTSIDLPGDQGSWVKARAEGPEAREIADWTWIEDDLGED